MDAIDSLARGAKSSGGGGRDLVATGEDLWPTSSDTSVMVEGSGLFPRASPNSVAVDPLVESVKDQAVGAMSLDEGKGTDLCLNGGAPGIVDPCRKGDYGEGIPLTEPYFADLSLKVSLPIFSDKPRASPNTWPLSSIRHENITIQRSRKEKPRTDCWGMGLKEGDTTYIPVSTRIKEATRHSHGQS